MAEKNLNSPALSNKQQATSQGRVKEGGTGKG